MKLPPDARATFRGLMRHRSFRRFFIGQGFSSLGDWIGMIAIVVFVGRITRDEFAVSAMLLARLLPALVFGPVSGVFIDRWNRKRLMIGCDVARGILIAVLPFAGSISRVIPFLRPLMVLFLISALLEMLTLVWQPAKDSVLPQMLPDNDLLQANSAILFAAYGTFPLSGAALGLITTVAKWLGGYFGPIRELSANPEHLAFFFDALTFFVSAGITFTLAIPERQRSRVALDLHAVWAEFSEGIRFIRQNSVIRPLVVGIATIFSGVGTFLAIAVFYVRETLGAGAAGFGLLVTAVGLGLGLGFASASALTRRVPREVMFSYAAYALGATMIAFASVSSLQAGLALGTVLGLFAGLAYPTGLTLVQENVQDEVRGRTLASLYSAVRLALVGSLALAPALAKLIGSHRLGPLHLTGSRAALWLGGGAILGAGALTRRAVSGRAKAVPAAAGLFLAFEGGEGSGKSTQAARLGEFLKGRGRQVVITHEPGGTPLGERIRSLLLDPSGPPPSERAEVLLYAADRAQHVLEVIKPALAGGKIVLSDRYIDSSLAYQGLARGLGLGDVLKLNEWAVDGLMPDLVFFLDIDPQEGLDRGGRQDRIEQEGASFHQEVRSAYKMLARLYPTRFAVIDAARSIDAVESDIRGRVLRLIEGSPAAPPNTVLSEQAT